MLYVFLCVVSILEKVHDILSVTVCYNANLMLDKTAYTTAISTDIATIVVQIIYTVVFIVLNVMYFNKRKHLFVN